jgi:primosomal protein N''
MRIHPDPEGTALAAELAEKLTALHAAQLDASVSSWDAAIQELSSRLARDGRDECDPAVLLASMEREVAELEPCLVEYRAVERIESAQAIDWERRAMIAVAEGRADLAQQAQTRMRVHLDDAGSAAQEAAALAPIIDACRAAIAALRASIEQKEVPLPR